MLDPEVEITGIVSATGVGAGRAGSDEQWMLLLTLDVWRVGDSELRERPLTLRRRIDDAELRALASAIRAESIVRVRARLSDDAERGAGAEFVALIEADATDSELDTRLEALTRPVTLTVDGLGDFTYDRRVGWYTGAVNWRGLEIRLSLVAEGDERALADSIAVARALWTDAEGWGERVESFAVSELLPIKNENWLEPDDEPLTPEQFVERMTLESITVDPEERVDFWHHDGDMFWGHSIAVYCTLSGGPFDADIPG